MIFYILSIALLIFGFGFVIFFHELGHFLAAKWAGVRVDQFAVGFGQAILCWRKGVGVRIGTTRPEYERRAREHLKALEAGTVQAGSKAVSVGIGGGARATPEPAATPSPENGQFRDVQKELAGAASDEEKIEIAAEDLGLGETEYRLNWMPLGGYVKMMGQDDLRPNSAVQHPKAYNTKPIGQRVVIVSAGVVMNVILAALLFMGLFLWGFNTQAAVVGTVLPGSPAQEAGLRPGDRILTLEGAVQHDFTKVTLNVALSREGVPLPMTVLRREGHEEQITITPRRIPNGLDFPAMGISKPPKLRGPEERMYPIRAAHRLPELFPAETLAIGPGDLITHVNGEPVEVHQYYRLEAAVQASQGEPVVLTIAGAEGDTREAEVFPGLSTRYWGQTMSFAGMLPRPAIRSIAPDSPVRGKLLPGDVVLSLSSPVTGDRFPNLTVEELTALLNAAGRAGQAVDLEVLRDGERITVAGITPVQLQKRPEERFGLSVFLDYDTDAVVADTLQDSAAATAGIVRGARITHVNDRAVENWFQVHRALAEVPPGQEVSIVAELPADAAGQASTEHTLELAERDARMLATYTYSHGAEVLADLIEPRKTSNPLLAAWWGATETRDFILQFYLTLQRMVTGQLSPRNVMGPVGIVQAGTHFAWQGTDWLIWFLAIISANLAVVNFLPIPVVDGGLFTFLMLEKIKGRPLSARTQAIAQFVGLAIILSVFILVTYQDIMRLIS